MHTQTLPTIGISAIATHQPSFVLENDWFNGTLSRKFVMHTGIESRRISWDDEVTMGRRAVEKLQVKTGCDLKNCAGVVFAVSSLVPHWMTRPHVPLGGDGVPSDRASAVAASLAHQLGISAKYVFGINWGCSGYSRAMQVAHRFLLPAAKLQDDQFLLVVTSNHTSGITDFGCKQTGALFGDMSQVTLLARTDSKRYPVRFALEYAAAESRPVGNVLFNFGWRNDVLVPTPDGGRSTLPSRPVFTMDLMGIGDTAPRAMAAAAAQALHQTNIAPQEVDFVVPHQAGASVVKLAAMKLEEIGVRGELLNGFTREVGNISSSSVPYVLQQTWDQLHGVILCPTAGVGKAGHASFSQGCVILRSIDATAA